MTRLSMVSLIFATACAASLTPAGERVRYSMKEEAPPHCTYVAEVDDWSSTMPGLKNSLRNEAGESGGNFLVIDTTEHKYKADGSSVYEGTGRAYRCPAEGRQGATAALSPR